MKSQILAGGRGLGTFKSGLQGGVHIVKADQVEDIAGMTNNLMIFLLFATTEAGVNVLHSKSDFSAKVGEEF